jgi:hypothetical protein
MKTTGRSDAAAALGDSSRRRAIALDRSSLSTTRKRRRVKARRPACSVNAASARSISGCDSR